MKVDDEVIRVLAGADIHGERLVITEQLDRPLYTATNKVLVALGGKWDRKAKAHVFPEPAEDAVWRVIVTGEVVDAKTEFQAFYTPPWIAAQVIIAARIEHGHHVLEPSAGEGGLAVPASLATGHEGYVECYDVRPLSAILMATAAAASDAAGVDWSAVSFHHRDFLEVDPPDPEHAFDRVVMNPPFTRQHDMIHVTHAFRFLKPGGRLVAIMTPAWQFRSTKIGEAFRTLWAEHGVHWEPLPDGSFSTAGTNVRTNLLILERR